jgi:hypothetical protein
MSRSLTLLACLGLVAACTASAAEAYEYRTRFVRWNGAAWEPLCNNTLYGAPGTSHRIRIEIGVFDDSEGTAPDGGFVGWNIGTLVATGGTNSRTPGCLPQFVIFPRCGCRPLPACPDPFTNLDTLDMTLGTQSPMWTCTAGGSPRPQPGPIIRGRNEYMQMFEFTTLVGASSYTVTAAGNLIAALEWRPVGTPMPPDCGAPGDPNDDEPGLITLAPFATTPEPFTSVLTVSASPATDCLGDGVPDGCQAAFTERLYSLTGNASGTPWSWCINSAEFPSVCNLAVPGVPAGQPSFDVAEAFAASINATPCPNTQLYAQAYSLFGTSYLVVSVASQVTGDTPFDLCVGASGGPASCCPAVAFSMCSFNPSMTRLPTTGQDCNANGHDDTIDIVSGRSTDTNNDGIPDDCQGDPCPADFNGDDTVNSQDFFDFLTAFFANQPSADFNSDQVINSQDFFDFLAAFFDGC